MANQGWKDSADAIRWPDGRLAEGPIALCEAQAYAHKAALAGADLLAEHGDPAPRRAWAGRIAESFRARFWAEDVHGPFPALALDGAQRPVATPSSAIGHLLGAGLLDADERGMVVRRLMAPDLDSG